MGCRARRKLGRLNGPSGRFLRTAPRSLRRLRLPRLLFERPRRDVRQREACRLTGVGTGCDALARIGGCEQRASMHPPLESPNYFTVRPQLGTGANAAVELRKLHVRKRSPETRTISYFISGYIDVVDTLAIALMV